MHCGYLRIIFCAQIWWIIPVLIQVAQGCQFYGNDGSSPEPEGVRFIRLREDIPTGKEVLSLRAYPRSSIRIEPIDGLTDHLHFKLREVNSTTAKVLLEKSLNDLVDQDVPQNLLKFRVVCSGHNGRSEETSYTSVTVYVEDVNDHAPVFLNEPYVVEIDESTPLGSVVYENIQAFDRDKPNTPNSDVHIALREPKPIDDGGPYFALESPHRPLVVLKRHLDFDFGIREFEIRVIASDRGTPVRRSNSTLRVIVKDNDDLPPKFTDGVYRTKINEFYPMTGKAVRIPLFFSPPIMAFDQDSLNATLIYDIISGNDRKLFGVNKSTGAIYLEKEIDLEEESLPGNTFVLQIEARQQDSPLKRALARIEVEVVDLNDNAPEFEVEFYNISIVENLPAGFSVLQVNAMDRDQGENAEFYYKMEEEEPSGAFLIDSRTGWITVRDQSLLDREARPSITMTVAAVERIRAYDYDRQKDSGRVRVEISLLDSNDNTPQFEMGNLYEFKVNVQAGVNTIVGKVTAKDPDEGRNGMILYELQRPKGSGYIPFRLDSQTGTLFVSGQLRRGRIALFIEASDQPSNPSERRFSLAVVTILVHAVVEESAIEFVGAPYEFWVGADVPLGSSVGQVRTTLDYEDEGEIMYDLLHSYSEGVPFAIEEKSGIITVIRELVEFRRPVYNFEAVANYQYANEAKGHLTRRSSRSEQHLTKSGDIIEINEGVIADSENVLVTNVTIHVVNPNDDRGVLMKGTNMNPIEFHIKENLSGAVIGRLMYKNKDKRLNYTNDASTSHNASKFRLNRNLNSKFRRNSTVRFRRDASFAPNVAYVTPMVMFDDVKEESISRSFDTSSSHAWMPIRQGSESFARPQYLQRRMVPNATDMSTTKGGKATSPVGMRFIIANVQDVANKITITDDGTLMTVTSLDREKCDLYRLTIIAQYSKGFVTGAGIYQVNIFVDDVNDNPPVFDSGSYTGIVYENSPEGTPIILNRPIKVSDADIGPNAKFNVTLAGHGRKMFAVEFVNPSVEPTKQPNYHTRTAMDDFTRGKSEMELLLLYSNTSIPTGPYFRIKLTGKSSLDRERENLYHLQLVATDSGGLATTAQVEIIVADVNDNAPIFDRIAVFKDSGVKIVEYSMDMEIYFVESPQSGSGSEYSLPGRPRYASFNTSDNFDRMPRSVASKSPPVFSILEDTPMGSTVLKVTATDEDSDANSHVFYEITSEEVDAASPSSKFFSIDRLSGEIKVSHPLRANSNVTLKLAAKDIGGLADTATIKFTVIDVNNHAPVFKKSWYSFDLLEGDYFDKSVDRIEATDADFGQNANVSYRIESPEDIPFSISARSGVLKVNGSLDRELKAVYEFHVVATDNAPVARRLSSSVEVEVNVLDVNDNAPEFIGFDDLVEDQGVFKAYLDRSAIPGTFVKQINAIDKDYAGNGNGLVMYALQHNRVPHLFEIDSRDGVITTASPFINYNSYEHINVTVVASDLGNPSKSSQALLVVNLQGEHVVEKTAANLFPHRYYELELLENNIYPLKLLQINLSAPHDNEQYKWSIVPEADEPEPFPFKIDPRNGSIYITQSLDREARELYRFKVRVAKSPLREGRTYPSMVYPIPGERMTGLADNEVQVVLQVLDDNDNSPKFRGHGRPIVTVIPRNANFGFPVMQVEAFDADKGKNAEVRYKLLNEPHRLFGIDEVTGKIRVLGPVDGSQRVYGFDVKATDRRGEDSGRSGIANVFVYVVEENHHVRLVVSGKPVDVERSIDDLRLNLSEATGMDIRVRLLEPHTGGEEPATDAFIYAVDPKSNSIVDMEDLQNAISAMSSDKFSSWTSPHILELSEFGKFPPRTAVHELTSMSGAELVSVIAAIIIFVGATATSVCVLCVRQKRRPQFTASETGLTYSISRLPSSADTVQSKTVITATGSPESKRSFQDATSVRQSVRTQNLSVKNITGSYDIRPREYIDVPLPKSVLNNEHNVPYRIVKTNTLDANICYSNFRSGNNDTPQLLTHKHKCECNHYEAKRCCADNAADSSDSYEDSLRNEDYQNSLHNNQRQVVHNARIRQGQRHSFSGVRDDLVQDSPRVFGRERGHSFRETMTDLEDRLQGLERSFQKPFHLEVKKNNSRRFFDNAQNQK